MKILFLGHSLVARRQWSFMYALINEGAEVLFCPPQKWGRNIYEGPSENCLPVDKFAHQSKGLFYYQYGREFLEKVVEEFKPDWIGGYIEPYSMAGVEIQSIAIKYLIKSFFFAYENLSANFTALPQVLKNNFWVIWASDQIFCGNQASLNFMKFYEAMDPVRIPHVGVETDLFMPDYMVPDENYYCIFIGRDVPEKNYALVKKLQEMNKKIEVYHPTNFIPDAKMPQVYHEGIVFLHTSIRVPHWKEQLGYVVAEAMSCGLSVVHSVEGDNMEWFGNTPGTHLADPRNPQEYLNKIERAIEDYPNEKGRKWVEKHFSNKAIAKKWLEVLRQ